MLELKLSDFHKKIASVCALILLIAGAFFLQQRNFGSVTGAANLEASYHVLHTMQALRDGKLSEHFFLPTVTNGAPNDKFISWGETVLDKKTGNYIYTSFPPAGFVVPFALFELFGADFSEKNLAIFSFSLGCVASILIFSITLRLALVLGVKSGAAVTSALLAATVSIFSREALQSQGMVYWSQTLAQVLLAGALLAYLQVMTAQEAIQQKRWRWTLLSFVFLFACTEWTGYVFGLGMAVLLWLGERTTASKSLARNITRVTVLAGIVTVAHYSIVLGYSETIIAFLKRFSARGASNGNLNGLIEGYVLSFGGFILIAVGILIAELRRTALYDKQQRHIFLMLLLAASIPIIENVVLMQHAIEFSFDRLKLVFPLALLIAFGFWRASRKGQVVIVLAIVLACTQNLSNQNRSLKQYEGWRLADSGNKKLLGALKDQVDIKCAVLLTNVNVRGYTNLLLNRAVYERQRPESAVPLMRERHACAAVYLDGQNVFTDLPRFSKVVITFGDGRIKELKL